MGNNMSNAAKTTNASKAGIVVASMNQTLIVILSVVAMLLLVLIMVYIVSLIKKNKLSSVILHDKVIPLDNSNPYIIESSKMGLPNIGQEFSYSFWIYLDSNYRPTSLHKLIFQRGNKEMTNGSYSSETNPLLFMDKLTNRLYIAMSTSGVTQSHTLEQIIQRNPEGKFTSNYLISYIDYLPLQRWVNVTVVSKENMMMVFFDADLYSVTSVSDITSSRNKRPIIRTTSGDATIGDKTANSQGYISHSQFFNYALSQREITKIYNTGPNKKSILSFIGLDKYGVRSPVYNIEDDAKYAA